MKNYDKVKKKIFNGKEIETNQLYKEKHKVNVRIGF